MPPKNKKYRFLIEKIDIDGDGIPDGDLIKRYLGDKFIDQKFVPIDKYNKLNDIIKDTNNIKPSKSNPKVKMIYKQKDYTNKINNNQLPTDQRIIVQDNTGFVQKLTSGLGNGLGLGIGMAGANAIADGISGLFDGDGE